MRDTLPEAVLHHVARHQNRPLPAAGKPDDSQPLAVDTGWYRQL